MQTKLQAEGVHHRPLRPPDVWFIACLLLLSTPQISQSYSVLGHEANVDAAWDKNLKPLLLKRYPGLTPERLKEAHAYAYGGCIIQDMGYYPLGRKFFSDLLHYVRTGDFVEALIEESQNANEYAFALGALAHYVADVNGHELATNRAVPITYPKLRRKYGDVVTYQDDPKAHLLVEFAFDVIELAGGRYAPQAYHDFIGFQVAKPVLERAFLRTYGLEVADVLPNEDLAIATYRRSAGKIIPEMTKVAWSKRREQIEKVSPGITREKFIYRMSRREHEKEFGHQGERPGFAARTLVLVLTVVPKFGPLRALTFKTPAPEAERLFSESFRVTLERYRMELEKLNSRRLELANRNLDTGKPTAAGEYRRAEKTYAMLLDRLEKNNFSRATPDLKRNVIGFYSGYEGPPTRKDQEHWQKTASALERLRSESRQLSRTSTPQP